mgnify:CR=1 FL=1|tara:strand:- start:7 stop:915 length:909 start_codon:yes stop_codon:yes gene_type:complete
MAFNDILSGFRVQSNDPIDSRLVCADLASRDAIPALARYEGLQTYVTSEQKIFILQGGIENEHFANISDAIQGDFLTLDTVPKNGESGYSHTGAFAGKPTTNNYVWQAGNGITYTTDDVNNNRFKVFSLDPAIHSAVDNPYWSTPTPTGNTGIGLFQGANLPANVDRLFDYNYVYNDNYSSTGTSGFEGSTGRIDLSDCVYGDQLRVRFDFNVIPQIANTTIEPALWYSNRDDSDNITFTFPLTAQPIFYGTGTVGNTYLNRIEISAWITSNEDVNALTLPAIKSDNQVIIQPLGLLTTIIR